MFLTHKLRLMLRKLDVVVASCPRKQAETLLSAYSSHMNRLSYLVFNCDEKFWRDKVGMHAFAIQRQGMKVTASASRVLRPWIPDQQLPWARPVQRYWLIAPPHLEHTPLVEDMCVASCRWRRSICMVSARPRLLYMESCQWI
jgi:hypothetical protein